MYTDEMRDADFEWFKEHYDEIYEKYGECYVAIKDKQIFGVYDSYVEGFHSAQEIRELGTFIFQHCNGDESGYTAYCF